MEQQAQHGQQLAHEQHAQAGRPVALAGAAARETIGPGKPVGLFKPCSPTRTLVPAREPAGRSGPLPAARQVYLRGSPSLPGMAFRIDRDPGSAGPRPCDGCGAPITAGARPVFLADLPSVLRTSYAGLRFHDRDCLRERARRDYVALGQMKSLNRTAWEQHATSNEERMLTLKALVDWAERAR